MHWIRKLLRMMAVFPLAPSHAFWHLHCEGICKCWLKMQKDYTTIIFTKCVKPETFWLIPAAELKVHVFMQSANIMPKAYAQAYGLLCIFTLVRRATTEQGRWVCTCVSTADWIVTAETKIGLLCIFHEAIYSILLIANHLSQDFWLKCCNFCLGWDERTKGVSALVTAKAEERFSKKMLDFTAGEAAGQCELQQDPLQSSATAEALTGYEHLLFIQRSSRSAWSNGVKRAMGRCFPKEASAFCGGRC